MTVEPADDVGPETDTEFDGADVDDAGADSDGPVRVRPRALSVVLVCIIALAALVAVGTGGWLIGHDNGPKAVSDSSVDAGFARDMSTHHTQAITMATYEQDYSSNPNLVLLAYDIANEQTIQVGQMQGWLDSWGLVRASSRPVMGWMDGHGSLTSAGLMPGMASPAELSKLESLRGTALDIDFLQLMIRHHQGGIGMEQYAAQHAESSYVRALALNMVTLQGSEIISMEQTLRQLGGSPLPVPAS